MLLVRYAAALVLATLSLLVLMLLARNSLFLGRFNLLIAPLSIAVGFVPLFRWYRRDAYPLGLLFVPSAYVLFLYAVPLISSLLP